MDKKAADLLKTFNLHANRFIAFYHDKWLCKNHNTDLNTIIKTIEESGLSYIHTDEEKRKKTQNALTSIHIYDRDSLQNFLDKNKQTLIDADWPTDADKFVYYMSYVYAPANTEIFDLMATCFNDNEDNPWLRKNHKETGIERIEGQRVHAEKSRETFKKLHPNW